ncbi:MAG: BatD family protein [Bacteroidales bacterium]|nr:BatD family protein [Candidatus Latescibacterota bacterium]
MDMEFQLDGSLDGRRRSLLAVVAGGFLALAITLVLVWPGGAVAADISVIANVESRDVYVGESFLFQIVIDGSGEVIEPDVSGLAGFIVQFMGGSNNSSQSISVINGRVQRTVHKGFTLTYRLTPKSPGRVTIPSININVEGTVFKTDPITISVKKPEESEDFKLKIELSRDACYVGEPVVLTVTWYLNRDVEAFNFTAPILENDAFDFELPEVKIDQSKKYFRIPMGSGEVIAEKGQGMLDGKRFVTLTFRLALIPRQDGMFDIPEFIVACESGTGIRNRRDFFDDFFSDNYRGRWRGSLKKYVVPSNSLSLFVKDLPLEGRPDGFAGHVGELKISTTADPVEVSVGDPITMNIVIEGPDYLGRIDLPSLANQPGMEEDFKIPEERADGRVAEKKKIFTQTLRARHDDVKEIPAIRIAYFDTGKEEYRIASSDPIPLVVRETRVVTASDAEGLVHGPGGSPLEKWKEGIAYNYEGGSVLSDQEAGLDSLYERPALLALVLVFPLLFGVTLVSKAMIEKRSADPAGVRARGALRRLNSGLGSLTKAGSAGGGEFSDMVMELLKKYLGDKLDRSGAALTAEETERIMEGKGLDPETISSVREVFDECERWAYSGLADSEERRQDLAGRIRDAARKLDRRL